MLNILSESYVVMRNVKRAEVVYLMENRGSIWSGKRYGGTGDGPYGSRHCDVEDALAGQHGRRKYFATNAESYLL